MLASGGSIAFASICAYNGNEKFYKELFMPVLHKVLSPEASQTVGLFAAKWALIPKCKVQDSPVLVRKFNYYV